MKQLLSYKVCSNFFYSRFQKPAISGGMDTRFREPAVPWINGFKAYWHVAIFDDFSNFFSTFGVLHFKESSNMAKIWQKMKKSLVQPELHH